jgi:hypothetical protein
MKATVKRPKGTGIRVKTGKEFARDGLKAYKAGIKKMTKKK